VINPSFKSFIPKSSKKTIESYREEQKFSQHRISDHLSLPRGQTLPKIEKSNLLLNIMNNNGSADTYVSKSLSEQSLEEVKIERRSIPEKIKNQINKWNEENLSVIQEQQKSQMEYSFDN
jgi:alpha-galactosidase/6-phospho-beta-glucosidase family protein